MHAQYKLPIIESGHLGGKTGKRQDFLQELQRCGNIPHQLGSLLHQQIQLLQLSMLFVVGRREQGKI